jgi:hypothetical protein
MNENSHNAHPPEKAPHIDLSKLDAQFAKAPVYDGDAVPTGRYHVRIQDAVLAEFGENEFVLRWELTILAGPFTNWQVCKGIPIVAGMLHIIKWDLDAVGLQLGRLSDLPQHLETLRGRELEVEVREQWERRDIHFLNSSQREYERGRHG